MKMKKIVNGLVTFLAILTIGLTCSAGDLFAAKPPADSGVLKGKVLDSVTSKSIEGAVVEAVGPVTVSTVSDSRGSYTLTMPGGDYSLTTSAVGYQDDVQAVTIVNGVSLSLNILLVAGGPQALLPHADKISAYAGPETCIGCHPNSIADDIFDSVHFQVRAVNPDMDIPGGGSHGMLDRACGLPGTTLMANNWAGTAISPVDSNLTRDDGCGKCHIAYQPPMMYPDGSAALPDLDCLRCHAIVYGEEWTHQENIDLYGENPDIQERHVITMPNGAKTWSQDRSLMSAQSVGNPVTTEACLRCHEHGLSGYKRATPFTPEDDVHANRGMGCTDCHEVINHKIARGNYVTDGMASDLPDIEVECINCHSATTPHSVNFAAELNSHVINVTCETCHIHQMEETPQNIHRRTWAPYTMDPMTGAWENTQPTTNGLEYPDFWDAYTEYHTTTNARPEIRWFNGGASMLAQPFGGYADRRSAGGNSRLFSLKPFVNGMLMDAGWLDNTPDPVSGTRMYSSKWFFEKNWDALLGMGLIDPIYPSPESYWTARPDMADMLADFPMLIQFSRPIFLEEAGTVIGTPTPGPQSAATYPGIAKAINSGMGTMAIGMGYFPPDTDPLVAGEMMWSGEFFSMWAPVNMDQNSAFFLEVVSFITMSHAITSNVSSTIDACHACHFTPDEYNSVVAPGNKYLSFPDLGYPDLDGNGMIDPMYDRIVPEICDDTIDNDLDGLVDLDDPDCAEPVCTDNEVGLCDDGIDNDCDGKIDGKDKDC